MLIHCALPCLLQTPAQFQIGSVQLFVVCLWRDYVDPRCRYRFLEGAHGLDDLFHGDVVPSRGRSRSLPRTPHIVGKLLTQLWAGPCFIGPHGGRQIFSSIDSFVGSLERQSLARLSPPENRTSLVEESITCKDKECLGGHLHFDAQVSTGAKKQ